MVFEGSWAVTAMGSVQSVGRGFVALGTVTERVLWRFKPGSCLVGHPHPPAGAPLARTGIWARAMGRLHLGCHIAEEKHNF